MDGTTDREETLNNGTPAASKSVRKQVDEASDRDQNRTLSPSLVSPPTLSVGEQEELRNRSLFLISSSLPYLHKLYSLTKPMAGVVLLSDQQGRLLEVLRDESGGPGRPDQRCRPFLRVGAVWAEGAIGMNSIASCLETVQPVIYAGPDTYQECFREYIFHTVPVRFNGQAEGAVSLLYAAPEPRPLADELLLICQNAMERQYAMTDRMDRLTEKNRNLNAALESRNTGLIMYDPDYRITDMNPPARAALMKNDQIAQGRLEDLFGAEDLMADIRAGKEIRDRELILTKESGNTPLLVTVHHQGRILILQENRDVMKMVNRYTSSKTLFELKDIIGRSAPMDEAVRRAEIYAASIATVLITGESGTGKELFAQAVHNGGSRRAQPFIAINCGAIPRDLIQSELFGYEAGSFTGASSKGSPGKFELADGGTLFLDEIGDMPLDAQINLLRVLQNGEVLRIGGKKPVPVDVRIIAATNADLSAAVANGLFRQDLYYRLNVLPLELPPLREREGDLPLLTAHFIRKISSRIGGDPPRLEDAAETLLDRYDWPGNIRELENAMERLVHLCEEGRIGEELVAKLLSQSSSAAGTAPAGNPREVLSLRESEKRAILSALKANRGNMRKSAQDLGISRSTLYEKIQKLDILPDEYR